MANQILAVIRSPELRENLLRFSQDEVRAMSWSKTASNLEHIYGSYQGALT